MKRFFLTVQNMEPVEQGNKIYNIPEKYPIVIQKHERIVPDDFERKFPPLQQVLNLTGFIQINTNLCQRDKILIYLTFRESMKTKNRITVPLCLFDEENFSIL